MKNQEPRSSSSCAACKLLKRRCTPNCQFAPYFHADEPRKFVKVHKVFGASNVSKILNEVTEGQREEAVNSLVYEAEVRLQDPVYGCIGAIATLQRKMVELQQDLALAQAHLACYLDQQPQQQPFPDINHLQANVLETSTGMVVNATLDNDVLPFDPFCNNFQFP